METLAEYLFRKMQAGLKRESDTAADIAQIKFSAEAALRWLEGEPNVQNAISCLNAILARVGKR